MADILEFKPNATSEEKLQELILYILNKCGPMTYGALCNMLWEIDARAYAMTGKSITQQKYYKEG